MQAEVGDSFQRGGKVWKVVGLAGKVGVLAYDEKKAATSQATPVCFLSPVGKGDVMDHSRKIAKRASKGN